MLPKSSFHFELNQALVESFEILLSIVDGVNIVVSSGLFFFNGADELFDLLSCWHIYSPFIHKVSVVPNEVIYCIV